MTFTILIKSVTVTLSSSNGNYQNTSKYKG